MTYVENSQKILKVINDFSKFTEYEANIQKSIVFQYGSIEELYISKQYHLQWYKT